MQDTWPLLSLLNTILNGIPSSKAMELYKDEDHMLTALDQARSAAERGEVPVGAVIVSQENEIIAAEGNRTIANSDPTAHAEILAVRSACQHLSNYRLTGATLYTTIEPCVMCAGTLVNARISKLVYGSKDERYGGVETLFRLCDDARLNHRIEIVSGILADECRSLMQDFFRARR